MNARRLCEISDFFGLQQLITEPTRITKSSSFLYDIAQQDWSCNGSEDPNVLWTDWKTKFLDIVNIHAPLRSRRARTNRAPWIIPQLKKGMRDRDAAKRNAALYRMIHAIGKSTKSCVIK